MKSINQILEEAIYASSRLAEIKAYINEYNSPGGAAGKELVRETVEHMETLKLCREYATLPHQQVTGLLSEDEAVILIHDAIIPHLVIASDFDCEDYVGGVSCAAKAVYRALQAAMNKGGE